MHPILTTEQLREQHDRLAHLVALLPDLDLGPDQRSAVSSYLFREGPELVRLVAEAEGQAGLRARLDRATVLRLLQQLLGEAARRAGELALCDQSGAVEDALAVIVTAREEAEAPGGRTRLDRLRPALRLLAGRDARTRAGRRRRKGDVGRAAR